MKSPADSVIAFSQLLILGLWEALGILAFGWNPIVIGAVWFVGLWTYNVLTATAVRTYFKLVSPPDNVVDLRVAEEDDIGA